MTRGDIYRARGGGQPPENVWNISGREKGTKCKVPQRRGHPDSLRKKLATMGHHVSLGCNNNGQNQDSLNCGGNGTERGEWVPGARKHLDQEREVEPGPP